MALVQELYDTVDLDTAVCGRFLGDGEYYFAIVGLRNHLEFYSIKANRPVKVHDVDLSAEQHDIGCALLSVYYTSGGKDYVLFSKPSDSHYTCLLWNGNELDTVVNHSSSGYGDATASALVPDVLWVYYGNCFRAYSSMQKVFEGRIGEGSGRIFSVCVLNKCTSVIRTLGGKVYLLNIEAGVARELGTTSMIRGVFPSHKYSKTSFIMLKTDSVFMLTTQGNESHTKRLPNLVNVDDVSRSHFFDYDKATGYPIFSVNCNNYFVFTGTEFVRLKTKDDISFDQLFPYLMSTERGCRLYAYNVNQGAELQYYEVVSTHQNVLRGPNWMERNLLGSNYYFVDRYGLNNLSKTMWFNHSKILSTTEIEPIEGMFSVGDNLVLVVGNEAAHMLDLSGNHVPWCWYKSGKTVYANANYQVQPTKIYTASAEVPNPLCSDIVFATSHGDMLVVGSSSEIAVLDLLLHVIDTFMEENVVDMFPGGYATTNKIQFLGKPAIELPNITAVGFSNSMLIVENGGPHALYSVHGGKLEDCKLGLGTIDRIDDCGVGNLILTDQDTILQKSKEFIRLGGVGRKCIFSADLMSCLDLENGVLSLKTNTGIQSSVRVEPLFPHEKHSIFRLCRDKLVWFHEAFDGMSTVVHVKALTQRKTEHRILPKVKGSKYVYFILRDSMLVEIEYPQQSGIMRHMQMTVYQWSDLEKKSHTLIPLDYSSQFYDGNSVEEISQGELIGLVHICFRRNIIFLVPDLETSSSHFPQDTLFMFHITERGLISLDPEVAVAQSNSVQGFGIRNLPYKAGIYPHEYPYTGGTLITETSDEYTSMGAHNAPKASFKEIDRLAKFVYMQDPRIHGVYSIMKEGSENFEFETFGAFENKSMFKGSVILPDFSPLKSVSVVCKNKTLQFATTYDPVFLASTGTKVYGITPLANLEYPETVRNLISFISECSPERELIPTKNLIDANALLAALLDEGNHAKFRELGQDPITWRRKLLAMAK